MCRRRSQMIMATRSSWGSTEVSGGTGTAGVVTGETLVLVSLSPGLRNSATVRVGENSARMERRFRPGNASEKLSDRW